MQASFFRGCMPFERDVYLPRVNFHHTFPAGNMGVRSAGKTDIGLKRKRNEDSFLIAGDLGLYIVADGVGGHKAGDVASRMVVETMGDYWRKVRQGNPPTFLKPIHMDLPEEAKHLINSITRNSCINNFGFSGFNFLG